MQGRMRPNDKISNNPPSFAPSLKEGSIQESPELVNGETCGPNQASERSTSNVLVIWNRKRGHAFGFHQDHVAAALPSELPTVSLESLADLLATRIGS